MRDPENPGMVKLLAITTVNGEQVVREYEVHESEVDAIIVALWGPGGDFVVPIGFEDCRRCSGCGALVYGVDSPELIPGWGG